MEKRGLSNLVATVLIILLALGGTATVWSFLEPSIEEAGDTINERTTCLNTGVEPKSCETIAGSADIIIQVKEADVKGITAVVELGDGSLITEEIVEDLPAFSTRSFTVSHGSENIKSVKAAAAIMGEDGELVTCPVGAKEIPCRQKGCASDSECGGDPHFTCEQGVCQLTGDLTVFVSSATHDGGFGGIFNVDDFCQGLADSSAHVPSGSYRAWVSNMNNDAIDRISRTLGTMLESMVLLFLRIGQI
jgi:FlaG/FlaF family flagellin (archaellin)